jgi:hypothetical protein
MVDRGSGSVVAVAGDPGGANAVAPVLETLLASGRSVSALAYRQARDVWRGRGIPFKELAGPINPEQAGEQLLALHARRLLVATSVNGLDLERRFTVAARQERVPSLAVLDFWSNYRLRFAAGQGDWSQLPDGVAVMDQSARAEMIGEGFPPDCLHVTGQPAFDDLQRLQANHTLATTKELRARLGVGPEERLILFASQPLAVMNGSDASSALFTGYTEHTVLAALIPALEKIAARRNTPIALLVRPHPRENLDELRRHGSNRIRVILSGEGSGRSLALAADLVTGMTTVLLVEACLMGCLVVSLQPGLRSADVLPTNRWGVSRAVYREGDIEAAIDGVLFDAALRNDIRQRARQCQVLPGAADRVVQVLDALTLRIAHPGDNCERIGH